MSPPSHDLLEDLGSPGEEVVIRQRVPPRRDVMGIVVSGIDPINPHGEVSFEAVRPTPTRFSHPKLRAFSTPLAQLVHAPPSYACSATGIHGSVTGASVRSRTRRPSRTRSTLPTTTRSRTATPLPAPPSKGTHTAQTMPIIRAPCSGGGLLKQSARANPLRTTEAHAIARAIAPAPLSSNAETRWRRVAFRRAS